MTAPYLDPDGQPSYQEGMLTRSMDAAARRRRLALAITLAYQHLLEAREAVVTAEARLAEVIAQQDEYSLAVCRYWSNQSK